MSDRESVPLLAEHREDGAGDAASPSFATPATCGIKIDDRNTKRILSIAVMLMLAGVAALIITLAMMSNSSKETSSAGATPAPSPPSPPPEVSTEFSSAVSTNSIRSFMSKYSAKAHEAGSPEDFETAEMTASDLRSFGFDKVEIEPIDVLLPDWNVNRSVELLEGQFAPFKCLLEEPPIPGVNNTFFPAAPVWGGWSAQGDVTGSLVFANYGRRSDFELLDSLIGSNLTGHIVIARYGKIFRGDIVRFASERGASGLLVYTDPSDFGYMMGQTFPEGPWANNYTAQRGSFWAGNGDPLTPGWPSETGPLAPKYDLAKAFDPTTAFDNTPLPEIPVQPLSSSDANALLRSIAGTALPASPTTRADWKAGFDMTHVGPGPARVRMQISDGVKQKRIWNVIGTMYGAIEPDRMVILGSHRDAWTFGAGDPISGHSVLLETGRVLGQLKQSGSWRPRRTLKICSWDAEEEGLIGSIEWVEKNFRNLQLAAAAYINTDIAVAGFDYLDISGSPSFQSMMREVTTLVAVDIPGGNRTTAFEMWNRENQTLSLLGTGSDYTGFAQHAGIPSLHPQFYPDCTGNIKNCVDYDAIYHSNYDCFFWYDNFGDPGFRMHQALTRVFGLAALRLLDDVVLPFNYEPYADFLKQTVDELKKAADAVETLKGLNWTRMHVATARFSDGASRTVRDAARVAAMDGVAGELARRAVNDRLMQAERAFLVPYQPEEVTGSNWYAHSITAPSKDNTYDGTALPGLVTAIAQAAHLPPASAIQEVEFMIGRIAILIDAAGSVLAGTF